jgi:ankyrin repeat protein
MVDMFYRVSRLEVVSHRSSYPDLLVAAFYGWVDIIDKMLSLGSNPDIQDSKGVTALHVACTSLEEASTEIVTVLMNDGADPDLRLKDTGFTPMHQAIWACRGEADPWDSSGKVEALLDGGADINMQDSQGRAPVHIASSIPWDNSLFKLLYQNGARLDLVDDKDRSILHYAAAYGDLEHIEYLRYLRLTEPDPEGKDINSYTPMNMMVWREKTEKEKLWQNMKRPTTEELASFYSLIEEIKHHRLERAYTRTDRKLSGGCFQSNRPGKRLNAKERSKKGKRLTHRDSRPKKAKLLLPLSIEEEGTVSGVQFKFDTREG